MEYGVGQGNGAGLETVRALHQTVTALREALEESKNEILFLKSQAWPIEAVHETLRNLSIENHILRRKLIKSEQQEPLVQTEQLLSDIKKIETKSALEDLPKTLNGSVEHKYPEDSKDETEFKNSTVISQDSAVSNRRKVKILSPKSAPTVTSELEDTFPLPSHEDARLSFDKEKQKIKSPRHNENLETDPKNKIEQQTDGTKVKVVSPKSEFKNTSGSPIKHEITHISDTKKLSPQPHATITTEFEILPTSSKYIGVENQVKSKSGKVSPKPGTSVETSKCSSPRLNTTPAFENKSLETPIKDVEQSETKKVKKHRVEAKIRIRAETIRRNISKSLESLTVINSPLSKHKSISFSKTLNLSNILENVTKEYKFDVDENIKMSERKHNHKEPSENDLIAKANNEIINSQNDLDQGDEVDDIELIFTTDDTKESDFKEELVSIDTQDGGRESHLLQPPSLDHDGSLDVSDREIDDDDVFQDNFENGNDVAGDWRRENSQLCDSKSDMSINQEKSMKSYYSLQDSSFENRSMEKDESFDRFEERIRIVETDISKCGIQDVEYLVSRRNTCPNPLQYKPLVHREAISKGLILSRKSRPILTHSNAVRKDSGAQTDISALPGSSWRSESSLASKAQLGENFMTLPSKCPLPGSRLRLSEKTVEARRVLLSDIGFTSMVPELSRSADHLFPTVLKPAQPPCYGQFLRATDLYSPGYTSQKFNWTATTASPSEGSQTQSHYSSIYPLSSPPAPSRRCSAPVSPSRKALIKETPSKVRFANGSLPELRSDWTTVDSGDSTDSLVEEAENYLRKSIDCIVSGRNAASGESYPRRLVPRRASAPEPSRDNVPPAGWQPFLPRFPRDLRLDHWVKVITAEGRVRGGRVRYIGQVISQTEQYVGVQLSNPDGYCDGTYNNRRYFLCERLHGIFVPFKKVIMGWRP